MIPLRDYQTVCVDSVFEQFDSGKSTLVVMPTGTGKTVCFAGTAKRWLDGGGGRVLVLAHRDELIQQAAGTLRRLTGLEVGIEMADQRVNENAFWGKPPIVVSSVQTMHRPHRFSRFMAEDFGLCIIDEAHHAVASTYKKILKAFGHDGLHVLGVTATPDRADEEALGQVFESVAFNYQLPDAIKDGWLVPIKQQFVQVQDLDFSECRTTAGDLNAGDLERILLHETMLHRIATPTFELAGERPTMVFTASVVHAHKLAEILNRHKAGCAQALDGSSDRELRRDTLKSFKNGDFQFLCNCALFTEGFDEPSISCIAVARPTKSRALYAQMVGRGTRPVPGLIDGHEDPDSRRGAIEACADKSNCLVLDFVGNAGKHRLITTADILGGNYSDDEIERAKELLKERSQDTQGTLEQARIQLEEEEEEKQKKEAKASEKAKHDWLKGTAVYTTRDIDPYEVWRVHATREPGWHKDRKPTDKQLALLKKAGIPDVEKLSFHQASQLVDQCIKRQKQGKCSYKQAKMLKRFGYDTDMSFTEASKVIGALAANGWRPLPFKVAEVA